MPRTQPIYDTIGKTYDTTRRPDPEIVRTLIALLQPKPTGHYLDIACGSGNYTNVLAEQGIRLTGIDISEEMLSKARVKNPQITWHQGDAKKLPFAEASFDGALCTLATHHIQDVDTAFREAYRVIAQGSFVVFTATPEQMRHYWLWEYFPQLMEDGMKKMASFERLERALAATGFVNIRQQPFFVTETLTDWFLHAGKYRPEMYLDPVVRAGISSFHLSLYGDEVGQGLAKLQEDIASGAIQRIIKQYESDNGDYLFIAAEKR